MLGQKDIQCITQVLYLLISRSYCIREITLGLTSHEKGLLGNKGGDSCCATSDCKYNKDIYCRNNRTSKKAGHLVKHKQLPLVQQRMVLQCPIHGLDC